MSILNRDTILLSDTIYEEGYLIGIVGPNLWIILTFVPSVIKTRHIIKSLCMFWLINPLTIILDTGSVKYNKMKMNHIFYLYKNQCQKVSHPKYFNF